MAWVLWCLPIMPQPLLPPTKKEKNLFEFRLIQTLLKRFPTFVGLSVRRIVAMRLQFQNGNEPNEKKRLENVCLASTLFFTM